MLDKNGANNYKLEFPYSVRLHNVFHVNNRRPCPVATPRPHVHVTTFGDNDTYDVANVIDVVKIDMVHGRRGNYLRFYTLFKDEQSPHDWHQLN
jgi:hypothetical protein